MSRGRLPTGHSQRTFRNVQSVWDRFDRLAHILGTQADAFRRGVDALERELDEEMREAERSEQ